MQICRVSVLKFSRTAYSVLTLTVTKPYIVSCAEYTGSVLDSNSRPFRDQLSRLAP